MNGKDLMTFLYRNCIFSIFANMGTAVYECGCSITTSMFSDRPILNVSPCMTHALQVQDELNVLADKLKNMERPLL